jgi:hypothetical protein
MRHWIRSHLTYANVMATIAVFLVLGGGTALASYVISSNSQVGPNTISGHHVSGGAHPNLIAGSVGSKDVADNGLTGGDIKEGTLTNGQVREFSRSIAAAGAGPPPRDMLSFRGLTISSVSAIGLGELSCALTVTANDAGRIDSSLIYHETNRNTGPFSNSDATPTANKQIAIAFGGGSRLVGQFVFHDQATGHTLTGTFSVDVLGNSDDINSQGCTWQGTVTAAG